jgi:hypothetical protein
MSMHADRVYKFTHENTSFYFILNLLVGSAALIYECMYTLPRVVGYTIDGQKSVSPIRRAE